GSMSARGGGGVGAGSSPRAAVRLCSWPGIGGRADPPRFGWGPGVKTSTPALIPLPDTNCPPVTATPLSVSVPAPGNVVISTARRALAGLSFGSLNPKSAVLNTYGVSSSVVTVLFVPWGRWLTPVTLTGIDRWHGSTLT